MTNEITYILENKNASDKGAGSRRFYIGFTRNLERRLKEHSKDRYKKYRLIWYIKGNFEAVLKKTGATKFIKLIDLRLVKGKRKNYCIDCGKEIFLYGSLRCNSCAGKLKPEATKFKKGEDIYPENNFKRGSERYSEGLLFVKVVKTKKKIRAADREWFVYWLGKKYVTQFETHHDWENGAYCYLLAHDEHNKKRLKKQ